MLSPTLGCLKHPVNDRYKDDSVHRMKLAVITVCIVSCFGNQCPSAQPDTTNERASQWRPAAAALYVYRAVRTASLNTIQVNFSSINNQTVTELIFVN